jgi:hypothetical protein
MSFNIPKSLLEKSSKVVVTVNIDEFGPRQKTALKQALSTGVIAGYSVPTQLAEYLRCAAKLPTIMFGRYGGIRAVNIPRDSTFFESTAVYVAAMKLREAPQRYSYMFDSIERASAAITEKPANVQLYVPNDMRDCFKKDYGFPPLQMPSGEVEVTVWQTGDCA